MAESARALVTGAAGFIGSHLVEQLVRDGRRVRAFVHYNATAYRHNLNALPPDVLREVEIVAGDIADTFAVDAAIAGCETVYHLAALIAIPYSYQAPASYVATNVTGTLNVLQAARRHDVPRVVHTSTSEVYGTAQYVPIDERHPLVGQSPYAASKIAADQFVESFHRSYGLPTVTVRPFNTYGPRQSARAIVPTIVAQALFGDALRLGNLDPVRDLTFVTDTVAGFIAAAQTPEAVGCTLNLGTGGGVTIGELAERVLTRVERRLSIIADDARVRPAASEVSRLISENRRMRVLTGWEPRVSLDEGLDAVIAWVRAHPEQYDAERYHV